MRIPWCFLSFVSFSFSVKHFFRFTGKFHYLERELDMANRKPVIKVLPDSIFHQLWISAMQYSSLEDFVHAFTFSTSKEKINFLKFDIDDLLAYDLLKSIWNAANLSFKEILTMSGMKKSEYSHFFCIPIRTLEDWYAGKSQCPAYIRLMFIRYFHITYLPSRITLSTISKQKKTYTNPKAKLSGSDSVKTKQSILDIDDDEFLDFINTSVSKHHNNNPSESTSSRSILAKTDYLDEILKR